MKAAVCDSQLLKLWLTCLTYSIQVNLHMDISLLLTATLSVSFALLIRNKGRCRTEFLTLSVMMNVPLSFLPVFSMALSLSVPSLLPHVPSWHALLLPIFCTSLSFHQNLTYFCVGLKIWLGKQPLSWSTH